MFFKIRRFSLTAVLLPLLVLMGCTSSTGPEFREGRLYAVNNARPASWGGYIKEVWMILEEVRYDVPFNMTAEGAGTGEGAVELSEAPLPGGMTVDVTYAYKYGDITQEGKITVPVDGNMTIDLYMEKWDSKISVITARVVPGKWDGVHHY